MSASNVTGDVAEGAATGEAADNVGAVRTCALVAASDFNGEDFSARRAAGDFDFVIAVDGGYASLGTLGQEPDLAMGDFDSLGYVPEAENVQVYPTHKNASDLEIALDEVVARGFARAIVYGALGGRLDHTVANLQMCARFAESGMEMELVGRDESVAILAGPAAYELCAQQGSTVSVFSATEVSTGVVERGFEYSFDDTVLSNRTSRGLSNETVEELAVVEVEQGTLFVFHPPSAKGHVIRKIESMA